MENAFVHGIGPALIDVLVGGESLFKRDTSVENVKTNTSVGGSVPNTLHFLQRNGVRTALWSTVGNDVFGSHYIEEVSACGIECGGCIKLEDTATSLCVILSEQSPRLARTLYYEKNSLLPILALPCINVDRLIFYHINSSYAKFTEPFVSHLKKKGCQNISLTVGAHDHIEDVTRLLRYVDVVVVARDYMAKYFPREDSIVKLKEFLDCGPKFAIITDGEHGCVGYSENEGLIVVEAYQVDAVDSTAAGDAFCGGVILGQCLGYDYKKTMRLGAFAGAMACGTKGSFFSMPRLNQFSDSIGP